jgi:hypothetical protein
MDRKRINVVCGGHFTTWERRRQSATLPGRGHFEKTIALVIFVDVPIVTEHHHTIGNGILSPVLFGAAGAGPPYPQTIGHTHP